MAVGPPVPAATGGPTFQILRMLTPNNPPILRSGELGDNRRQPLRDNFLALWQAIETLRADNSTLRADISTLTADVATLKSDVATLKTDVATLKTDVAALKTESIAFVFAGTPVPSQTINVPLTYNLLIPANLAGSRYRNATNPLVASTFTLTRITSTGSTTTIGTVNVSTVGAGTFTGSGSNALVAGDTLRMTATVVGGSLSNVGITIQATRR